MSNAVEKAKPETGDPAIVGLVEEYTRNRQAIEAGCIPGDPAQADIHNAVLRKADDLLHALTQWAKVSPLLRKRIESHVGSLEELRKLAEYPFAGAGQPKKWPKSIKHAAARASDRFALGLAMLWKERTGEDPTRGPAQYDKKAPGTPFGRFIEDVIEEHDLPLNASSLTNKAVLLFRNTRSPV